VANALRSRDLARSCRKHAAQAERSAGAIVGKTLRPYCDDTSFRVTGGHVSM
jgi:hypothetical protein